MKAKILSTSVLLLSLALLVALLPGGATFTKGQGPEPPNIGLQSLPCPPEGGCGSDKPYGPWQKSPEGYRYMPEGTRPPVEAAGVGLQATGGPDDFGYTWDDSVVFNWIDATGGTDSGLTGFDEYLGPVEIGFDFKFYENTYSHLYFNTNGLVAFGERFYHYSYSNRSIPNPAPPNNFIAPFWDDLCVRCPDDNSGTIYYMQGGSAPNRYFVIEWHEVSRLGSTDLLTFEVILYENGDILLQYLSLSGYLTSATVGIEDNVGVDGLQYLYNAPGLSNNKAVRLYRPGPMARVKVWPLYQGRFTRAGETVAFQVFIRNTGELGSDAYDLFVSTSWPVSLYAADGTTLLTDSDDDGTVDTGPVAQGSAVTITVKVQTPAVANVGDDNAGVVTVRSSLETTKRKTAALQTAVPAPFAQVFCDNADGAMSLYLVQPSAQTLKKATPDGYYSPSMAVAKMADSFAYFWTRVRSEGSMYVAEIEYTLLDSHGDTVVGVSKLTDHSGATMWTFDYDPAVAVAPNGCIGVIWYRRLSNSTWNYNIYYAILDASGNVVVPPTNLTNNPIWGSG